MGWEGVVCYSEVAVWSRVNEKILPRTADLIFNKGYVALVSDQQLLLVQLVDVLIIEAKFLLYDIAYDVILVGNLLEFLHF